MGFARGHTKAVTKREAAIGLEAAEDIRCSLLGNSFSCPAVAFLVGHVLHREKILAQMPTAGTA